MSTRDRRKNNAKVRDDSIAKGKANSIAKSKAKDNLIAKYEADLIAKSKTDLIAKAKDNLIAKYEADLIAKSKTDLIAKAKDNLIDKYEADLIAKAEAEAEADLIAKSNEQSTEKPKKNSLWQNIMLLAISFIVYNTATDLLTDPIFESKELDIGAFVVGGVLFTAVNFQSAFFSKCNKLFCVSLSTFSDLFVLLLVYKTAIGLNIDPMFSKIIFVIMAAVFFKKVHELNKQFI